MSPEGLVVSRKVDGWSFFYTGLGIEEEGEMEIERREGLSRSLCVYDIQSVYKCNKCIKCKLHLYTK